MSETVKTHEQLKSEAQGDCFAPAGAPVINVPEVHFAVVHNAGEPTKFMQFEAGSNKPVNTVTFEGRDAEQLANEYYNFKAGDEA